MSTTHEQPTGIEGLKGREPVGAALTIGIKGPSGAPTEKDRFHIVWPRENASGIRPHHPGFKRFNDAPPDKRTLVLGDLVHATRAECFEFSYRNQKAANQPSHPAKVPFCVGNGKDARRYFGTKADGTHDFRDIMCPGERCEFRQPIIVSGGKEKPSPCKPWMRFLFRLRWQTEGAGMPPALVKFTSQSWNTIKNFVGLFDHIERAAKSLGLTDFGLLGFPIALQLQEQTSAAAKTRFPVVSVTPLIDPVTFFTQQLDLRARIAAREPIAFLTARPAALTDEEEQDEAGNDHANQTPGINKPGTHEEGIDPNHPAWRDLGGDADGSP